MLAPLLVPIFDTAFALCRRALAGRPVYESDLGHIHHRLVAWGLSPKRTVLVLTLVTLLSSAVGFLAQRNPEKADGGLIATLAVGSDQ